MEWIGHAGGGNSPTLYFSWTFLFISFPLFLFLFLLSSAHHHSFQPLPTTEPPPPTVAINYRHRLRPVAANHHSFLSTRPQIWDAPSISQRSLDLNSQHNLYRSFAREIHAVVVSATNGDRRQWWTTTMTMMEIESGKRTRKIKHMKKRKKKKEMTVATYPRVQHLRIRLMDCKAWI